MFSEIKKNSVYIDECLFSLQKTVVTETITIIFQLRYNYRETMKASLTLVLIHNGHKLDIRHKKFMIYAVDILLIFT
jgi:hypothetical protein